MIDLALAIALGLGIFVVAAGLLVLLGYFLVVVWTESTIEIERIRRRREQQR